ncbi:hypothetical protein CDAR_461761 [Caerostris darwini]|uniref:Uncharacterized protein n=1 Tax=Caerostris darwini TaxID=1538125 RepID=A0AAV4TCQ1_9ARAC|nr:hypothetical protein CDAR_461761 [Caerostris darwini]
MERGNNQVSTVIGPRMVERSMTVELNPICERPKRAANCIIARLRMPFTVREGGLVCGSAFWHEIALLNVQVSQHLELKKKEWVLKCFAHRNVLVCETTRTISSVNFFQPISTTAIKPTNWKKKKKKKNLANKGPSKHYPPLSAMTWASTGGGPRHRDMNLRRARNVLAESNRVSINQALKRTGTDRNQR